MVVATPAGFEPATFSLEVSRHRVANPFKSLPKTCPF
jgi:hypothetical protein